MSRSSTIVIAHLMLSRGMSLREAHDLVKERRPFIEPNEGFAKQLIELESELGSTLPNETDTQWRAP